jgi:molybdopterin converting factor small subunit
VRVTVKLIAFLRKMVEGHEYGLLTLELPEGTTVSQAVEGLGIAKEVRMLLLNGKACLDDKALKDGDHLTLIPPQMAYNMYVATNFLSPMVREDIRKKQEN